METQHSSDAELGQRVQMALVWALERILTPLVRIFLHHRVPCKVMEDAVRRTFVKVAYEEGHEPGQRNTIARVTMLTGVPRQDVKNIVNNEKPAPSQVSRIARVVEAWRRDERFLDEEGQPLALPVKGSGTSFEQLVRLHASDVPPQTMLPELISTRTVDHNEESGVVKLITRAYVPRAPDDPHLLQVMGIHAERYMQTMVHNVRHSDSQPWYEQVFATEALSPNLAAEFRQELRTTLDRFLTQVGDRIEQYEDDHRIDTYHLTAGVGVYYFEQ